MKESEQNIKKPFRLMYKFWLDVTKTEEHAIAETIDSLKEQRTFSKTLRDGIRLIHDLRQGKLTVLLDLFPWVKDQIALEIQLQQPSTPTAPTSLQDQLNRMEQLLIGQGTIPLHGGKQLSPTLPTYAPESPSVPDFNLEVKQAQRDENNNSTYNFLIASALNVYGNCDSLPPEAIEYGLKTGRIPASMIQNKVPPRTSGNPKAMLVPQFDAPELDLDDIELAITDHG